MAGYYCQKRCFVKNKNSDRNHCLLLSWFSPQICPQKLIFLYFSIVFLFIKTINNNKSERLIYTIMFAGGMSLDIKNRSSERFSSILTFLQYPCTDGMGNARFVICFSDVFGDFFEFWISVFHDNGVANDFQHGTVIFFVADCHGLIFGQS